jgi:hypothetical protein
MSYHYSAIPHFRELFDCPSYFYCTEVTDYVGEMSGAKIVVLNGRMIDEYLIVVRDVGWSL